MEKKENTSALLFDLYGKPSMGQAFPLALQHVVAMIVGCVTPAIIVAGAGGLSDRDSVILIQAALVVSALTTLVQLYPLGKGKLRIGSGLQAESLQLWLGFLLSRSESFFRR